MGNKKDMYDLLDDEIEGLDISDEQKKALKKLNYVNKKHLIESIKQNQQREKSLSEKIVEKIATSDGIRKAALAMQGISEANLNPAGLALKTKNYLSGKGFQTGLEKIEPQDETEQMIEKGSEELYDMAMGYALGAKSYDVMNDGVSAYRLSKAYDRVKANPTEGNPQDILMSSYVRGRGKVSMPRGAAVEQDGKLYTQGKPIRKAYGTERNYGMTKEVHTHDVPKEDVQQLIKLIRKNEPTEITKGGHQIYHIKTPSGKVRRIVLRKMPIDGKERNVIISDYFVGDVKTPIKPWP